MHLLLTGGTGVKLGWSGCRDLCEDPAVSIDHAEDKRQPLYGEVWGQ